MYCRRSSPHICEERDGEHIEGPCKCEYGTDLESDHTLLNLDPRCHKLRKSSFDAVLEAASLQYKWMDRWKRGRNEKPNAQDALKAACYNLSDKQIREITKYVRENYHA